MKNIYSKKHTPLRTSVFTAHTNGRNYHLSSVHFTTTDYKENCPETEIKASANINTNSKKFLIGLLKRFNIHKV